MLSSIGMVGYEWRRARKTGELPNHLLRLMDHNRQVLRADPIRLFLIAKGNERDLLAAFFAIYALRFSC
jgi:hypothetical protein